MIVGKHTKQPIEVKDYVLDYSLWLSESGDTLLDANVSIECLTRADDPPGTTLAVKLTILNTALGQVAVWLEKGTDGERYKVTVTVQTNAGRVDQSEFILRIKEI